MDLLEYQGKQLFARHGVPVPEGKPATTVDEAVAAADEIGYPCVVKAQVLIGGRGKAGGIKVAKDRDEAREHAERDPRHGHQGPHGRRGVDRGGVRHRRGVLRVDRLRPQRQGAAVHALQGGRRWTSRRSPSATPKAIARLHVDPLLGFQAFHGRRLAYEAGLPADVIRPVGALLAKLYDAFVDEEAMLVEVNPLVVLADRSVKALDAKVTLDGNSLFRHADNAELRNPGAEDEQEQMADERGLTYVKLDGDIGILGNGAGLVMSTLDVVAQFGGKPANFLDAGGGSKAEAITSAVEVILSDPKVKAVLFNIFGGITRCDEVANGLIEAFTQLKPAGAVRRPARRDQRRRGPQDPGRGGPAQRGDRIDHERGGREGRRAGSGGGMSVIVGTDTKLCVSGITGREGTFHTLNNQRYGTERRRRRHARQGRPGRRGHPGLQHLPRRRRRDRRQHGDDLRPAAVRRRLDPRGRRRGHRDDHLHHRGHPRPRRAAGLQLPQGPPPGHAADRPQLPGRAVAGQGERRDHPGRRSSRRATSASSRARAR